MNPGSQHLKEIFTEEITPALFERASPTERPSLVLLVGQPGSGRARLAPQILRETPNAASVNADDLAAFHPDFLELTHHRPFDAPGVMSPAVVEWLSQSIQHTLSTSRSLLLTSTVNDPAVAIGTAAVFADAGYVTRLVIVSARPSASLLTTTSRFLAAQRLRLPARFVDRDTHTRGYRGTQSLVHEAVSTAAVNRLSVLARDGSTLFEARRADEFSGAGAVFDAYQRAPISALAAAEWFGELRRITEYVRDTPENSAPLIEVLVELHELALNEVLPNMEVRQRSSFVIEQEARLSRELVELRRALPSTREPATSPVSPVYVPPPPTPRGPAL